MTGENCAVMLGWSSARIHHGGEATWMERCNARVGHEDAAETLPGPAPDEGGAVQTLRGEPAHDSLLDRLRAAGSRPGHWPDALLATTGGREPAGPLQGDHRSAAAGVPEAVGAAIVRRGESGRLRGRLQPGQGLRTHGSTAGATRSGRTLRDAGRTTGGQVDFGASCCRGALATPWWWW